MYNASVYRGGRFTYIVHTWKSQDNLSIWFWESSLSIHSCVCLASWFSPLLLIVPQGHMITDVLCCCIWLLHTGSGNPESGLLQACPVSIFTTWATSPAPPQFYILESIIHSEVPDNSIIMTDDSNSLTAQWAAVCQHVFPTRMLCFIIAPEQRSTGHRC